MVCVVSICPVGVVRIVEESPKAEAVKSSQTHPEEKDRRILAVS